MTPKKPILYFLAIAIAVAFSGCSKKPRRPNPIDTVMGSGSSDRSSAISDVSFDESPFENPGDALPIQTLEERGERGIITVMVYFDFDSSSIKVGERAKLTEVADYLRANPSHNLILEGHCDWRGTPEYNLALGERRSSSVKQYLATLGVSGDRLEILSKGDLNAIEDASDAIAAQDRRVEFLVLR